MTRAFSPRFLAFPFAFLVAGCESPAPTAVVTPPPPPAAPLGSVAGVWTFESAPIRLDYSCPQDGSAESYKVTLAQGASVPPFEISGHDATNAAIHGTLAADGTLRMHAGGIGKVYGPVSYELSRQGSDRMEGIASRFLMQGGCFHHATIVATRG